MFGCDLDKFIKSVTHVLPYKGESMSRFYICNDDETQVIKLCFYRKTLAEIHGVNANVVSQTDAEIRILELFRDTITDKHKSPCILRLERVEICDRPSGIFNLHPECDYDTKSQAYNDVMSTMCKYSGLVKNGLAHDKCAFLTIEKCDVTLKSFMLRTVQNSLNDVVFRSLLFQIIHACWTINKLYPGFHHYDLHSENIMLKFDYGFIFKVNDPKYLQFTVDNVNYYVPYFGITPKIIDFQFGVVPNVITSNVVQDLIQMFYRSDNDLLFLFHHIYHMNVDVSVRKLLKKLDPTNSYMNYHTDNIRKISSEIPTYTDMVTNQVWNKYKKPVPKNKILEKYIS